MSVLIFRLAGQPCLCRSRRVGYRCQYAPSGPRRACHACPRLRGHRRGRELQGWAGLPSQSPQPWVGPAWASRVNKLCFTSLVMEVCVFPRKASLWETYFGRSESVSPGALGMRSLHEVLPRLGGEQGIPTPWQLKDEPLSPHMHLRAQCDGREQRPLLLPSQSRAPHQLPSSSQTPLCSSFLEYFPNLPERSVPTPSAECCSPRWARSGTSSALCC